MTAKEFARLQKQLALTDAELAQLLDVDRRSIWRWRTGKSAIERVTEFAIRYLTLIAKPGKPALSRREIT